MSFPRLLVSLLLEPSFHYWSLSFHRLPEPSCSYLGKMRNTQHPRKYQLSSLCTSLHGPDTHPLQIEASCASKFSEGLRHGPGGRICGQVRLHECDWRLPSQISSDPNCSHQRKCRRNEESHCSVR